MPVLVKPGNLRFYDVSGLSFVLHLRTIYHKFVLMSRTIWSYHLTIPDSPGFREIEDNSGQTCLFQSDGFAVSESATVGRTNAFKSTEGGGGAG